jgi:hypothetical protein
VTLKLRLAREPGFEHHERGTKLTASRVSVIQLADLLDEVAIRDEYDYSWLPEALREIEGNQSLRETCELVARELEKRHGTA